VYGGDMHIFKGWAAGDGINQINWGDVSAASSAVNTAARLVVSASAPGGAATGEMQFWTNAGDSIGQRMTIDKDGNAGIGTTSPSEKLEINTANGVGTLETAIRINNPPGNADTAVAIDFCCGSQRVGRISGHHESSDDGGLRFYTVTGNTGGGEVGTTTEALKLDASQNATFAGDITLSEISTFKIGVDSSSAWLGFGATLNNLKIGDSGFGTAIAEFNMSASVTALQIIKDTNAFTGYFYNDNGAAQGLHIKCKSNDSGQTGRYLIKAEGYGSSGAFSDNFLVDIDGNATFAGDVTVSGGNVSIGEAVGSHNLRVIQSSNATAGISIRSTQTNSTSNIQFTTNIGTVDWYVGKNLTEASSGSDFHIATGQNGNVKLTLDSSGNATFAGDVLPSADNSKDLGDASYRWANLYVADAHYSNVGTGGNDVDGTEGSWTIQEGEEDLFLLNRKNGKKFKFKLEEIE
jgi:hypothetical protein